MITRSILWTVVVTIVSTVFAYSLSLPPNVACMPPSGTNYYEPLVGTYTGCTISGPNTGASENTSAVLMLTGSTFAVYPYQVAFVDSNFSYTRIIYNKNSWLWTPGGTAGINITFIRCSFSFSYIEFTGLMQNKGQLIIINSTFVDVPLSSTSAPLATFFYIDYDVTESGVVVLENNVIDMKYSEAHTIAGARFVFMIQKNQNIVYHRFIGNHITMSVSQLNNLQLSSSIAMATAFQFPDLALQSSDPNNNLIVEKNIVDFNGEGSYSNHLVNFSFIRGAGGIVVRQGSRFSFSKNVVTMRAPSSAGGAGVMIAEVTFLGVAQNSRGSINDNTIESWPPTSSPVISTSGFLTVQGTYEIINNTFNGMDGKLFLEGLGGLSGSNPNASFFICNNTYNGMFYPDRDTAFTSAIVSTDCPFVVKTKTSTTTSTTTPTTSTTTPTTSTTTPTTSTTTPTTTTTPTSSTTAFTPTSTTTVSPTTLPTELTNSTFNSTESPSPAGSPPGFVGVVIATGAVAVGTSPLLGIEALLSIQLISVFGSMACSVPGVGGSSISYILTPIQMSLGNYGKFVGQVIMYLALVSLYGAALLVLSAVTKSTEKACRMLRHPRAIPLIHQLLISGFTYEACMLLYGNDDPAPWERLVGAVGLVLSICSVAVYPYITLSNLQKSPPTMLGKEIGGSSEAADHVSDDEVERVAESSVAAAMTIEKALAATSSAYPEDCPIPSNLAQKPPALVDPPQAHVVDGLEEHENDDMPAYEMLYRYYDPEHLATVWWPVRHTVTPRSYWLHTVLRGPRSIHASLKPEHAKMAVANNLYRSVAVCIVCAVPSHGAAWCESILSVAAALCFLHAAFLLVVRCQRIPIENIFHAMQSATIGAVAVANVAAPDSGFESGFAVALMVFCIASFLSSAACFLVEQLWLSECRHDGMRELGKDKAVDNNEESMQRNLSPRGGDNSLSLSISGRGRGLVEGHLSHRSNQRQPMIQLQSDSPRLCTSVITPNPTAASSSPLGFSLNHSTGPSAAQRSRAINAALAAAASGEGQPGAPPTFNSCALLIATPRGGTGSNYKKRQKSSPSLRHTRKDRRFSESDSHSSSCSGSDASLARNPPLTRSGRNSISIHNNTTTQIHSSGHNPKLVKQHQNREEVAQAESPNPQLSASHRSTVIVGTANTTFVSPVEYPLPSPMPLPQVADKKAFGSNTFTADESNSSIVAQSESEADTAKHLNHPMAVSLR